MPVCSAPSSMRSIGDDALHLRQLDPYISDLDIHFAKIGAPG